MRFYFETYGCTMNQGEARIMQDTLKAQGHTITGDINDSDALVLVTCTVIETTERKMIKRLDSFSRTGKPVIVAGCMASVQEEQILESSPHTIILPPHEYGRIQGIISELEKEDQRDRVNGGDFEATSQTVPYKEEPIEEHLPVERIIPISSGCLGSCSYCITRIARGELRSSPIEMLITGIEKALDEGHKEIWLTAQDTAAYGADIDTGLPELLRSIHGLQGDFRVRVGMMNPENALPVLGEMIEAYRDPRIYKFLHVPVQSGSKKILEMMGRKYKVAEFLEVVEGFRRAYPDIMISTDVIVGFPGEREEDFKMTADLVNRLKPDILNITRFSARPKTRAENMKNSIPSRIAKDRSRELTRAHAKISEYKNKGFIGRRERILITEPGKKGTMMGRTDAYKTVVIEERVDVGRFVEVKIIHATGVYLKGRIL